MSELDNMDSKQLELLISAAQFKLLKRRAEEARARGETFASLGDIPGKEGHVHNFQEVRTIGTEYHGFGKRPVQYECTDEGCQERAYSCPNCDFVPGEPLKRKYDEIDVLSGSAGYEHLCRVCGVKLGRTVMMRS